MVEASLLQIAAELVKGKYYWSEVEVSLSIDTVNLNTGLGESELLVGGRTTTMQDFHIHYSDAILRQAKL